MTPTIKKHIGTIFTAIAAIGQELIGEGGENQRIPPSEEATRAGSTGETAMSPPKRTRRTKEQIAADEAAAAHKQTAPPVENTAEVPEPAASTSTGLDLDGLKAIIEPAVREAKGEQVKKIIATHVGKEGGRLSDLVSMPEKHDAFRKDIEALLY